MLQLDFFNRVNIVHDMCCIFHGVCITLIPQHLLMLAYYYGCTDSIVVQIDHVVTTCLC